MKFKILGKLDGQFRRKQPKRSLQLRTNLKECIKT